MRIGRAISLGMAEAGYDVAVHYNRSQRPAQETARRIEGLGRRAMAVGGDVSRSDEIGEVVAAVEREFGRLDVLVNSAASFESAPLLDSDEETWDRVMAVNLKGPYLMVRDCADLLTRSAGSVVNIVDLSAFEPWVDYPHHSVAKAGLMHLTRILARVMAPHVRVNAIAPGVVLPPEDFGADDEARELARTPVGHLGSPQDVVRTVLFLVGSSFMTGEVVVVDGGRGLTGPGLGRDR